MTDDSKPERPQKGGLGRRSFLRGAGFTAAGTAVLDQVELIATESANHSVPVGPGRVPLILNVNGKDYRVAAEPRTTLAEALRFALRLTGTKVVCDRGACSACTVWLDKTPVNACMTLAIDVGKRRITTIEGLAKRRRSSSNTGRIHQARCAPMRVLHSRDDHELCCATRTEPESEFERCKAGDRRKFVPLRYVPEDLRCCSRRGSDAKTQPRRRRKTGYLGREV
jgi:hypothetical protein